VLGPTAKGRWSYACSKLIDEFLAIAYYRERGLPTVVGRLFNTVGPRQTGQYGMVVPTFVKQALSGQPLTVFGDGTQSRCFTHVRDVVEALIALMQRSEAYGQVFNIGGTEEITMRMLAEQVVARTGTRVRLLWSPTRRPTSLALKTCRAECRTSASSTSSSAGSQRWAWLRSSTMSSLRFAPRVTERSGFRASFGVDAR